jgi:hypothetical protein
VSVDLVDMQDGEFAQFALHTPLHLPEIPIDLFACISGIPPMMSEFKTTQWSGQSVRDMAHHQQYHRFDSMLTLLGKSVASRTHSLADP